MAKKSLREGRDIIFADDVSRTIYPLTIRQLRVFMKTVKDLQDPDSPNIEGEDIDLMIKATSIALEKVDPDLAADLDALEDVIDIRSFNEVLAAAMGTDPNV